MLTYEELKTKPRKFLTFTSLTVKEFLELLPAFKNAYEKVYPASQTKTGEIRKRKTGGGRKSSLDSIEQKLLFALVYQKSYPLQSFQGELFGMVQSRANEWVHRLLPILKQALDDIGVMPERDPKKFKEKEENQSDAADSIIDAQKDVARDRKRLKNKLCTIVARRKSIATRTSSLPLPRENGYRFWARPTQAKPMTRRLLTRKRFLTLSRLRSIKIQDFKATNQKCENYISRKKAAW